MVGCLARPCKYDQRAILLTQKMLSAVYSSRSSASADLSFASAACRSSKASDMYLRKIRPRTTCLYSPASMLPLSFSAADQRVASKPKAEPFGGDFLLSGRGIARVCQKATQVTSERDANQRSFGLGVVVDWT